MSDESAKTRITRANIKVLQDRRTYLIGSTVLLGKSLVVSDESDCPTAYTNGRDKFYGEKFCDKLNIKQCVYLVLHENIHVFKMDIRRHMDLIKEDAHLFNVAADYVDNLIIESEELGIRDMIERPPGALVDTQFTGWSVREVYRFLKTGRDKAGNEQGTPQPQGSDGKGNPTSVKVGDKSYAAAPMDEHDAAGAEAMTAEEAKQLERDIQTAVQQATLMAGAQGSNLPRQIRELIIPDVDWRTELQDFLTSSMQGMDDLSFRKYDRRYLGDDYYMPTVESERIGTLVLAMDASGSTSGRVFDEFCGGMADLLEKVRPEKVRVLHWDTGVNHDQVLEEADYLGADLREILKPRGGGGTYVSSVSDYIIEHNVDADACLVMTDGYVECEPHWQVPYPTLWLVTVNDTWTPPTGRLVHIK